MQTTVKKDRGLVFKDFLSEPANSEILSISFIYLACATALFTSEVNTMSKLYKIVLGTALAAGLAGCLQTQQRKPEQLYHWHKSKVSADVSPVKTQQYARRCTSEACISSSTAPVGSVTEVAESKLYDSAPIASQDTVAAPVTSMHNTAASGLSSLEPLIVRESITIDKGYARGGKERNFCVMRTQEELTACWNKLYEGSETKRTPPTIDFSKEIVVGIFQGEHKKGYDITIMGALEGKRALELLIQEQEVPAGRKYHNTTTQSYHFVILPKTTKDILNVYLKSK